MMKMVKNKIMNLQKIYAGSGIALGVALSMLHVSPALAGNELASNSPLVADLNSNSSTSERIMTGLNFSSLPGNKVQIELGFDGAIHSKPRVFQTDNPARIALDFSHTHSRLDKKMYPVNQGLVKAVYVVEALGRTRIIINLIETPSYEVKTVGDKVYVIVKSITNTVIPTVKKETPVIGNQSFNKVKSNGVVTNSSVKSNAKAKRSVSSFLPEQTITHIDFRRGQKGEGRILVNLSTPNTMVDV
jgi:type IV pilus assembly protein PilQ